jgi:hypothetical protein
MLSQRPLLVALPTALLLLLLPMLVLARSRLEHSFMLACSAA